MMSAKTGSIEGNKVSGQHKDCNSCAHFFITWNKKFPYGCRAIGFMSSNLPNKDVLEVEGRDCLAFTQKHSHESEPGSLKAESNEKKGRNRQVNVVV